MKFIYLGIILVALFGCSASQISKQTTVEDIKGDGILLLSTDVIGKNFSESIVLIIEKFNPETRELEKFTTISITGLSVKYDFEEYVTIHAYRFPPGEYTISGFEVNGGNNTQSNADDIAIYFGVTENKVNYIGEIKLIKELDWSFGGNFDFKISDKKLRDYPVFKSKFENLQSMEMLKMIATKN